MCDLEAVDIGGDARVIGHLALVVVGELLVVDGFPRLEEPHNGRREVVRHGCEGKEGRPRKEEKVAANQESAIVVRRAFAKAEVRPVQYRMVCGLGWFGRRSGALWLVWERGREESPLLQATLMSIRCARPRTDPHFAMYTETRTQTRARGDALPTHTPARHQPMVQTSRSAGPHGHPVVPEHPLVAHVPPDRV